MTIHVDETAAHAVYAPSSAHRWTVCTASATAIAALGDQEEGEEAAKGTAAHEELERVLNGGDPDTEHPAAYAVALAIAYVKGLPPGKMWVEQRVHLTENIWGRCDIAHFEETSGVLTIVDLKNGFVDVDAVENEQLRIYGAASMFTHRLPVKWVRYVVVQPNSFMPVPRVKQWIEPAEDLHAWASKIAAIPRGELTFKAGEQCTYCPLFGRCPASKDVLVQFNSAIANPADQVRSDQVAMFLACKKPIDDWFKALDKAATKRALEGKIPAGMKLVTTIKHRAWKPTVIDALKEEIATKHGVKALDLPTPAQAEKLAGIDVESLSDRPDGSPTLAFESDKRAPWKPKSVEEMFRGVSA